MSTIKTAPLLQQLALSAEALPADAAEAEQNQGVVDIHFHPWQQSHIFVQGPAYHYWVTRDYGATYEAYKTPGNNTLGFWMEIKIHPRVPDWILAKVRRFYCVVDLQSSACAHDLFVSKVCAGLFHRGRCRSVDPGLSA